jgi:hypothetical protein
MIREKLIDRSIGDNQKFRWRSHESSRIEGLSDAVFAFAVTLLVVVSLEVPKMIMGKRRRKLEERFSLSENAALESN